MRNYLNLLLVSVLFLNCSSDSDSTANTPIEPLYFPPITGTTWETKPINELDWNEDQVQPLLDFLEEKHTKGFMILVNGRIVMEHYFNGHNANLPWYWASAGKTLTTATIGIAEEEGLLNINTSAEGGFYSAKCYV